MKDLKNIEECLKNFESLMTRKFLLIGIWNAFERRANKIIESLNVPQLETLSANTYRCCTYIGYRYRFTEIQADLEKTLEEFFKEVAYATSPDEYEKVYNKLSSNEDFLKVLDIGLKISDILKTRANDFDKEYDAQCKLGVAISDYMDTYIPTLKKGDVVFIIDYKDLTVQRYIVDHMTEKFVVTSSGKRFLRRKIRIYEPFFKNHPEFYKYERSLQQLGINARAL